MRSKRISSVWSRCIILSGVLLFATLGHSSSTTGTLDPQTMAEVQDEVNHVALGGYCPTVKGYYVNYEQAHAAMQADFPNPNPGNLWYTAYSVNHARFWYLYIGHFFDCTWQMYVYPTGLGTYTTTSYVPDTTYVPDKNQGVPLICGTSEGE